MNGRCCNPPLYVWAVALSVASFAGLACTTGPDVSSDLDATEATDAVDSGELPPEEARRLVGTCPSPVVVSDGPSDLFLRGPDGIEIEMATSPAAAYSTQSCFPLTTMLGSTVLEVELSKPSYLALAVENLSGGLATQLTIRRSGCDGAVGACAFAPAGAVLEFGQDVPSGRLILEFSVSSPDGFPPSAVVPLDVWLAAEGREDCGDGIDNDDDDSIDCDDPVCFFDAACNGGHTGETCDDAIPLLDQYPDSIGLRGGHYSSLSGAGHVPEVPGNCLPGDRFGNGVVFSFFSASGGVASLTASAFYGDGDEFQFVPRLIPIVLYSGSCQQPPSQCKNVDDPNLVDTHRFEFPAGMNYIVVGHPRSWPELPYRPEFKLFYDIYENQYPQ